MQTKVVVKRMKEQRTIRENKYLISIPGMKESIVRGMKVPVKKLSTKIKW